jgi:predicted transcriptional regulator YdeE
MAWPEGVWFATPAVNVSPTRQPSIGRVVVGFGLVLALGTVVLEAGATMSPKIVELDGFTLIGIEARTNNTESGRAAISEQWGRFFQEGILERIPNKLDSIVYALYTDYERNRDGEFSLLIGGKANDDAPAPPGMVKKSVPKQKYAVVPSAAGPVAKVVPEAWKQVWNLEDSSGLGGPRSYRADFELYGPRSRDPNHAEVDLYIGIR